MRKIALLTAFVLSGQATFSQTAIALPDDSVITNVNEPLFNGREHLGYNAKNIGTAYFQGTDWQYGSLLFQDIPYKNTRLKYDAVTDEVIVPHPNGSSVILFTPRVKMFTLNKDLFLFLPAAEAPNAKEGFYQQIVEGKLSLYAKRSKKIVETVASDAVQREFVNAYTYYILKDGQYHPVKRQKDIMALTGDKKNEISAWLKTSRIRFKSDPESAMTRIVEYYNQISL